MITQRVTFEKFVQDGEVAVLYSPDMEQVGAHGLTPMLKKR